jgi:hypothetical protein
MSSTRLPGGLTSVALLAACGLAVFATQACGPNSSQTASIGQPAFGGRPECPGEADSVRFIIDTARKKYTVSHVPLSGPITNIPEFHDCQNFITRTMQYDSLFAIFAAFRLANKLAPDSMLHTHDSLMVGGQPIATVAAATIFSASLKTYEPLGIQPGFNCLYLYHPANDTSQWGARMIPLAKPDSDCTRSGISLAGGKDLYVYPHPTANATLQDYPEVARWDWDDSSSIQFIGIACRLAWCEIGPKGFKSSPPINPVSFTEIPGLLASSAQRTRVTRIKGWYDRQILATRQSGQLVPSAVVGVIVPNGGLARVPPPTATLGGNGLISMKPYDGLWVNVGAVVIPSEYKGLRAGVNHLFFCHGSTTSCRIAAGAPTPTLWTSVTTCNTGWFGMVINQADTLGYGCIFVKNHGQDLQNWINANSSGWTAALPATARWRWMVNDESGGWYGCQRTSCCRP